jgi:ABC-type polysaccharide/polyol phosphate transport system ATPase subunit
MAHITLSDITVRYPIYSTVRQRSLLTFAANRASFGRVAREAGDIPVVEALRNISIEVKEGERLALIGRNGSGKTTLLKLCAGLILPDEGRVEIEGSRAAIINPGAGLDADKTGAENVDLIGRLLGVRRVARQHLLDDVAEFTELGDFINLPVRTYSAGMQVRLLFALATSIERDILIVDEVIGAGDAHFVEKAAKRVNAMFSRAKALVLATHSGEIAARLCTRAVWLNAGREVMSGTPEAVWDAYKNNRSHLEAVA